MKNEAEKGVSRFVDLNIVLFPDDKTRHQVIEWSRALSEQFDTYFVLDSQTFLPHLSIYSTQYPSRNQKAIEDSVKRITNETSPFIINTTGLFKFANFVFLMADISPELLSLHSQVVDELNPLREGRVSDNVRELQGLTAEQQKAVDQYGYLFVKDTYTIPHITIARLRDETKVQEAIKSVKIEPLSFVTQEVAFAAHGTCPQPIKTFQIK